MSWNNPKSSPKILEYARAYSREYRKDPEKLKKHNETYRKWYEKNGRDRASDYVEAITEWRIKHPEAIKAKTKVQYAIKAGKLVRPLQCTFCKRETRLSGHHEDYNKPLEVIWLCSSCHKNKHLTSTI